jgi:hypothetical protein
MLACRTVRRFLERRTQDEIHRATHDFLGLAGHLQKLGDGDG